LLLTIFFEAFSAQVDLALVALVIKPNMPGFAHIFRTVGASKTSIFRGHFDVPGLHCL
jgi:hypothetical protein